MNGNSQHEIAPAMDLSNYPGLDPAVIQAVMAETGWTMEEAAQRMKNLAEAMAADQLDAAGPVRYTNRAARRARQRAEKRAGQR